MLDELDVVLAAEDTAWIEKDERERKPIALQTLNDDDTLALLRRNRVLEAERANLTVREALNDNGATLTTCAKALAELIQSPEVKPDVRRRAVCDVLTLHNAMPAKGETNVNPTVQVFVQTSEHVNLANILNPPRTT
jgi:hypothetical protein